MNLLEFVKNNFSIAIILILIAIIVFQRSCKFDPTKYFSPDPIIIEKPVEIVKYVTDTIRVPVTQVVYKEGPTVYRDRPIYIEIPRDIDTANILKEYFAITSYRDTIFLKNDIGYVSVLDSISQNQILSRSYSSYIENTILSNSIYMQADPKYQLFGGIGIGAQRPNELIVLGNLTLKSKTDKLYSIGIGVNSELRTYMYGSLQWPIKFINY